MKFRTKHNYRVYKKHDRKISFWQNFWTKKQENGWNIICREIRKMMGELTNENKIIRKIDNKYNIKHFTKDTIDYYFGYLKNLNKNKTNFNIVIRDFGWKLALKLFNNKITIIARTVIIN